MKSSKKIRLDTLVVSKKLVESREKAKALILSGNVLVNGAKVDKAGALVSTAAAIEILKIMPYVSRGGIKLEAVIKGYGIDMTGRTAMDVGASTGGFTDCLLQNGIKKVYAVDVGYGQFDWKLRNDPRVVLLEKTNIRYLESDAIPEVDLAVIDVSFISLRKVVPKVMEFLKPQGEIIALVKPQFELQKKDIAKGGVVKDEGKRLEAVEKIVVMSKELGLENRVVMTSPIKGAKGNVEYFIYLKKVESSK